MSEYTPPQEPWTVVELDDTHAQIYGIGSKACDGHAIPIPDAERIVACVNFCAQFDTELLRLRHLVNSVDLQSLADVPNQCGLIPVAFNGAGCKRFARDSITSISFDEASESAP